MNDKMIPAADPDSPSVRLLRAIYGLCPDCDIEEPHSHGSYINGVYWPLKLWHKRPAGEIEPTWDPDSNNRVSSWDIGKRAEYGDDDNPYWYERNF